MSDFLNNLARRSLGSAEIVQPRLPALFEQVQPAAGSLFAAGPLIPERGQENGILAELQSEATSKSRRTSLLSAANHYPASQHDDESGLHEHFLPMPPKTTVAPAMTWPQPFAPTPSSTLLPEPPGVQSSSPLLKPPSDDGARLVGRLSRAGKDAKPLPESEPSSRALAEPRERAAEMKPRLPIAPAEIKPQAEHVNPQHSTVADLPATLRRIIESRLKTQPQSEAPTTASRQGSSSEPTIQVTIGRIEVRATQQPPPAAKSSPPSPVMSLDDYLRRRSQRGSR